MPRHHVMGVELRREACVPAGAVIVFDGRPLKILRATGTDAAAPVITQEMMDDRRGVFLKGQLGIWSARAVGEVMRGQSGPGFMANIHSIRRRQA